MLKEPDYSLLDNPDILQLVFYPRRDWTAAPSRAKDYLAPVNSSISISCRFYPAGKDSPAPAILYFHGNGEVACDYDLVAPDYNELNISLFVADYRGYGLSGGSPNFSSMIGDSHHIFDFFIKTLEHEKTQTSIYLMGRSLGALSAVELACRYPEKIKGLIIESGVANAARLLRLVGFPANQQKLKEIEEAIDAKTRSIRLPALVIHGQYDSLIPLTEGVNFHKIIASKEKRMVVIPGADHNDIMMADREKYFSAIKEFIFPSNV